MVKGKRVFVSGGAGVIGRRLVERLVRGGATVLVGDLEPRPHEFPPQVLYRRGDLNYLREDELVGFAPHVFFHLAATFERSEETPDFWEENFHHNVQLSHHLATLCTRCTTLEKIIFASSYLIYDPNQYLFDRAQGEAVQLSEHSSIRPRNLCGAAKLYHELELAFLTKVAKAHFEVVNARIFRSYGRGSRDVISRWISSALNGDPITVFAEDGMFDYVYADEVAEGLLALAKPGITGTVNLSRGRARRVRDVVTVLTEHFPELKVSHIDADVPFEASQADMRLFGQLTGQRPTVDIEEAIPRIIESQMQQGNQSSSKPLGVLLTSISAKVPLLRAVREAIQKVARNGCLHGADSDPSCIGRHFVDVFWNMPPLSKLSLEEFVSYCRKHQITVVIPTRDGELSFFSDVAEEFKQHGISVMVSPPETVRTCADKLTLYSTLKDFRECPPIPTATSLEGLGPGPFVVKERFGAGSGKLGLRLGRNEALDHASKLSEPIFQPMIEGVEYSVDLYVTAEGEVKGVVARTRDKIVGGESWVTTSKRHPQLEKVCSELARRLGVRGHAIFQVIEDEKGQLHLVECNCRFGGASTLSVAVGLDSFYWFLLESLGEDIKAVPFSRSSVELRQIRHVADRIDTCP